MDLFALVQNQMGLFFLLFVRVSGIFTAAPIYGSRNVPIIVKAGLSLILALVLLPILGQQTPELPKTFLLYLFLIMTEYIVGLIIGFTSTFVFSAIQMAGSLIDTQIGFSMVNIIDPLYGQNVPLIGNFKYMLALLVFLATNGHHLLLTALLDSFRLVPVTHVVFSKSLAPYMVDLVAGFFAIALKISLPVLVTLLLLDIGMGILAKTMPQMNIFMVGMPAKILIGLFMLSMALPFYIFFLEVLFNGMQADINKLIQLFQAGP
ncbi:MAG: flagellar biosynthetic protein FliR [Sporomusaceae bacterium]|nr:flagellar biosynthetic protein FliR [Sporomusaceae bacterium]